MIKATPGKFSRDVLYQGEVWVDATANVLKIADLEASHIDNVIRYLERRSEQLYWDLMDFVSREDMMDDLFDTDPVDWMKDTPLYEALVAEKRRRSAETAMAGPATFGVPWGAQTAF